MDCRKKFTFYVLIDAESQIEYNPMKKVVRYSRHRWKRHGKKGRRNNKQERAPKYYPTQWWDQH